ncbi:pilus assembly protein (plasmid) [Nonomuraea sp. NBC_00507]|uniref:TadE/TadG family type IV pilus assembly protein n=1 Tax=Nonomuraea sp. NBC_00507 TaxID=2976002 RepID=UPI002E19C90E
MAFWSPRRRGLASRERGSETVGAVIMLPVLFLAILVSLQTGLWFLARSTALAAAQEGVRAARSHNAPLVSGKSTAEAFAAEVGDGLLDNVRVRARAVGSDIDVQVSATVPSLIPGLTLSVSQGARGPRERFTTPQRLGEQP